MTCQGRKVVIITREVYELLRVWCRPVDVPKVQTK